MIIKLANNIYSESAVAQAVVDFAQTAEFKVSHQDNYNIVEISNPTEDIELIKKEFCNYILSLVSVNK